MDDGTGVIGCTCWVNEGFSPPSFKLGDLVTINGKLGAYNDQLQVSMSSHRKYRPTAFISTGVSVIESDHAVHIINRH